MWPGLEGIGKAIYDLNSPDEPPADPPPVKRVYPPAKSTPVRRPTVWELEAENRKLKAQLERSKLHLKKLYAALVSLGISPTEVNDEIQRMEAPK